MIKNLSGPSTEMQWGTLFDVTLLVIIALVFAWGRLLCNQDFAEDVVMVVNSMTDPTLFFPGSNRIINLSGLAASWIKEAQPNYHFQITFRIIFALLWPYVALRFILRRDLSLLVSLTFHAVVLAQFSASAIDVIYGSNHPYSASLFFLFSSLLFARRFTKAATLSRKLSYGVMALAAMLLASESIQACILFALMSLASWGIISVVVAALATSATPRSWSTYLVTLGRAVLVLAKSQCLSAGLFLLALGLTIYHGTQYAEMYPDAVRSFSSASYTNIELSFSGVVQAFRNMTISGGGSALLTLELIVVVGLATLSRRRSASASNVILVDRIWFLAVIVGSLGYVLFLSQLEHIKQNDYNFRYFVFVPMGVVMMAVASAAAALPEACELLRRKYGLIGVWRPQFTRLLTAAAACVTLLHGSDKFGLPTTECTSSGNSSHRAMGNQAVEGGYFALLGSYWDIWPATFHAWRKTGSIPLSERVFPTGYRSETLNPDMLQIASRKLIENGYLKILCVGKGKTNTEFGTIACGQLLEFNRNWGVLPHFGTYSERAINDTQSEMRMEYRPPLVKVGDHWNLAADNKYAYLLSGWLAPQPSGAWTLGKEARLSFALKCETSPDLTLEFDVSSWAGMAAQRPAELGVDVVVNGKRAAHWVFRPGDNGRIEIIRLDAAQVRCGSPNDLRFNIDYPQKPRTTAGFVGRPDLGIALSSLSFK